MSARRLLVFSDLDGTLLDHHGYSHAQAEPALATLAARKVPLMLATSKTQAEVRVLRHTLGNEAPFVVENGGAVVVPPGYFDFEGAPSGEIVLGTTYARVREAVIELRRRFSLEGAVVGFGDLDAAGVAELTGLSLEQATLAKQRLSSEPLCVPRGDRRLQAFVQALEGYGLTAKQGGRFLSVQGPVDKATGMRVLVDCFRRQLPGVSLVTVAVGDSHNDLEMLRAADMPVVILPAVTGKARLQLERDDVILPDAPGPQGFRQGIETVLSRYDALGRT